MASTDKSLKPGTILHSPQRDYTILRTLGAGGFGITYLVQGKIDNVACYFAVKEHFMASLCERGDTQAVCYSAPVSEQVRSALKDFIAEAGRLNKQDVRHPSIVGINEVFEANNTAYYVMEFIPGKNVRKYVGEAPGGLLPEKMVLEIMTLVLDALALMHSASITHLDIKPDNILLSEDPLTGNLRPVIIDFGLSKHYDAAGHPTSTINVAGCSEGYSPVEQYAGLTEFSPTADVYAVAATIYFMLTGHSPLKATEMTSERVYSDLSHICSQPVATAIAHAMSPVKNFRTQSVPELAKELGIKLPGQRGNQITPPPYVNAEPTVPPHRRIDGTTPEVEPKQAPAVKQKKSRPTPSRPTPSRPTPRKVDIETPTPPPVTPLQAPGVPPRPKKTHESNQPTRPPRVENTGHATGPNSGPASTTARVNTQKSAGEPTQIHNSFTPPPPGNPPSGLSGPAPERPKKHGTMIVFIIVAAVIALIILFAVSILGGSDEPAVPDSDTEMVTAVAPDSTAVDSAVADSAVEKPLIPDINAEKPIESNVKEETVPTSAKTPKRKNLPNPNRMKKRNSSYSGWEVASDSAM